MQLDKLSDGSKLEKWVKDEIISLGLPTIGKPDFPMPNQTDVLGLPKLGMPQDLGNMTLRDLSRLKIQWAAWMLHAGYLLSVIRVKETIAEEDYETAKKDAMASVQAKSAKNKVISILEAEAEKENTELVKLKNKYMFLRTLRIYLAGHDKIQKRSPGGMVSYYSRGVEIIDEQVGIKRLEFGIEKEYGGDGTGRS